MLPVSTTDISERSIRISRLMRFIESLTTPGGALPCNFRAGIPKMAELRRCQQNRRSCAAAAPSDGSEGGLAAILDGSACMEGYPGSNTVPDLGTCTDVG